MNVQETIAHLNTLTTAVAVEEAIAEESRTSVLKHAEQLIAKLKADAGDTGAGTTAAGEDGADDNSNAGDAGEGAGTNAPSDTDAAGDQGDTDADAGDDQGADGDGTDGGDASGATPPAPQAALPPAPAPSTPALKATKAAGENKAPVIQGKGNQPAPKAKYVVLAPHASGKVGYNGHLYTRAEIAARPDLQEALYNLGCRAVRKAP